MINIKTTQSISNTFSSRIATLTSPDTRNILRLSHEQGWHCTLLGQAPYPEEPLRIQDWLIVPAHLDSSNIPDRALGRIQTIYASGLRPKGFVVVHEAPMLLAEPGPRKTQDIRFPMINPQVRSGLKLASTAIAIGTIGTVAISGVAILAVAGLTMAALLFIPAAMVMGVTVLDPILITVTKDDYWIEIDRWDV